MNKISAKALKHRIDAYRKFADELRYAIEDYRYQSKGGKLFFAVDFSEIFAYILPAKSYMQFFLFNQELNDPLEIASAQAFHQLLLKHIFFESKEKLLLLLPPYILELKSFVDDLHHRELDELINIAAQTFRSAGILIKEESYYKNILSLADKVDSENEKELSQADESIILNFFQEYGHILALADDDYHSTSALAQLRKLLDGDIFETLNEFADRHLKIYSFEQTDIFSRWNNYLSKERGAERSASAKLDASAMDLIGQINQGFQSTGVKSRLLFFTRSYHMHDLFNDEFRIGRWKEYGDYHLLRHPRVYSALSILAESQTKNALQIAKDQLRAIDTFLNSLPKNLSGDNFPEDLQVIMDKIQSDWEKLQALVLSKKELPSKEGSKRKSDDLRKILELVKFENIQRRIVNRLDKLLHEIEFSYDRLAFYLQLPAESNSEQLSQKRKPTTQSIPCTLQFSSKAAKKLVDQFGPGKEFEIRDVARALRAGFSKKQDYEIILAMAYILGTINRWEVAEGFCSYALYLGRENNEATAEGKFYLAICKRKLGFDLKPDWFFDAQNLLDEAIREVPTEPRYLKEKGLQIILMDLIDNASQDKKIPPPEEGLKLLDMAEKNLDPKKDIELLVQIWNNRLYYYITKNQIQDIIQFRADLKRLEQIQTEIEPDESLWPSFILDTLAWGEWVLYFDDVKNIPDRKNKITLRLERARDSEEIINAWERLERVNHLDAVLQDSNEIRKKSKITIGELDN